MGLGKNDFQPQMPSPPPFLRDLTLDRERTRSFGGRLPRQEERCISGSLVQLEDRLHPLARKTEKSKRRGCGGRRKHSRSLGQHKHERTQKLEAVIATLSLLA